MASFDEILAGLHDQSTVQDDQAGAPIKINSRRQFEVPADYDLVIAYAGDKNSQEVTFELPLTYDTHNLFNCQHKLVKWKNVKSGVEGTSKLNPTAAPTDGAVTWTATWEVPPLAVAAASALEVSIVLYDKNDNNLIAFSWNTSTFKGFSVGETLVEVEAEKTDDVPYTNEILNIDVANRTIVAPAHYNFNVCNYGDIGVSKIYFAIDEEVCGMKTTLESPDIYVDYSFGSDGADSSLTNIDLRKVLVTDGVQQAQTSCRKVLIPWEIPTDISNNQYGYTGTFTVSLRLETKSEEEIVKRWTTTKFSKLQIVPSSILNDVTSIASRDEDIINKVIEKQVTAQMDEQVGDTLIKFFNEYKVCIDANIDSTIINKGEPEA